MRDSDYPQHPEEYLPAWVIVHYIDVVAVEA